MSARGKTKCKSTRNGHREPATPLKGFMFAIQHTHACIIAAWGRKLLSKLRQQQEHADKERHSRHVPNLNILDIQAVQPHPKKRRH